MSHDVIRCICEICEIVMTKTNGTTRACETFEINGVTCE